MKRWLLLLLLPQLLSGCARMQTYIDPYWQSIKPFVVPGPAAAPSAWDLHRAKAQAVTAWTLQGRVGVQSEREGVSASVRWVENAGQYRLRLIGPLSQGSYELEGGPDGVLLRTPEGQSLTAENPEGLLQSTLGWTLPVAGLRYWIRGIPAPGSEPAQLRLDESGRLTDVSQDGWRISVLRYTSLQGVDLPQKIFMESAKLKLRIAVQSWTLGSE